MRFTSERAQRLVDRHTRRVQRRLSLRIEIIARRVYLITARAEQRTGEHLCHRAQHTRGEVRRIVTRKAQLARGRLRCERRPRRRLGARDVLWVRLGDRRGVAGRVDLDEDVDSACGGVGDDVGYVGGRVDRAVVVCGSGGEFFEAWDDEREALGVDDVPVELVELDPAHGIDGALDV